ncbi:DUF1828 domain-containing protein [Marinobacter sp. 1Y8]
MMNMTCDIFFKEAGWHCAQMEHNGHRMLYVSTPVTLAQGKPLDFYLVDRGQMYELTDDGITMFALRTSGFALDDKRNWRGLSNLAIQYGFELEDDGAFSAVFEKEMLPAWSDRFLRLIAGLAQWEADRYQEADQDFSFAAEIEMLLRAKAPTRTLEKAPTIHLHGSDLHFDFLWGNTYVDAVKPIAQSVNPKLRKALLLSRENIEGIETLFILDDRVNKERAEEEQAILGQVAQAIKFSDFESFYKA